MNWYLNIYKMNLTCNACIYVCKSYEDCPTLLPVAVITTMYKSILGRKRPIWFTGYSPSWKPGQNLKAGIQRQLKQKLNQEHCLCDASRQPRLTVLGMMPPWCVVYFCIIISQEHALLICSQTTFMGATPWMRFPSLHVSRLASQTCKQSLEYFFHTRKTLKHRIAKWFRQDRQASLCHSSNLKVGKIDIWIW